MISRKRFVDYLRIWIKLCADLFLSTIQSQSRWESPIPSQLKPIATNKPQIVSASWMCREEASRPRDQMDANNDDEDDANDGSDGELNSLTVSVFGSRLIYANHISRKKDKAMPSHLWYYIFVNYMSNCNQFHSNSFPKTILRA